MSDETKDLFPCNECNAGMMHLQHITYFTWLDDELVTVPNFPAWVCDMCGRREYDSQAVSWLVAILNPETGKTAVPKRRPHLPLKKRNGTRPSPE
jgi:YgiT-type zinc finger domain-containing protein